MWVVEPNSPTCLSAALPAKRHSQESRWVVGLGAQGIALPSYDQGPLNASTHKSPVNMAEWFDPDDVLFDGTVVEIQTWRAPGLLVIVIFNPCVLPLQCPALFQLKRLQGIKKYFSIMNFYISSPQCLPPFVQIKRLPGIIRQVVITT